MEILLAAATISTNTLVWAVVQLIIAGVILWVLNWAIAAIGLPEPFAKICKVLLILAAAVIAINALLTLVGKPLFVLG